MRVCACHKQVEIRIPSCESLSVFLGQKINMTHAEVFPGLSGVECFCRVSHYAVNEEKQHQSPCPPTLSLGMMRSSEPCFRNTFPAKTRDRSPYERSHFIICVAEQAVLLSIKLIHCDQLTSWETNFDFLLKRHSFHSQKQWAFHHSDEFCLYSLFARLVYKVPQQLESFTFGLVVKILNCNV